MDERICAPLKSFRFVLLQSTAHTEASANAGPGVETIVEVALIRTAKIHAAFQDIENASVGEQH